MITGFILAGGASSRMGSDKALLALNGRSFIERLAARLGRHVSSLIVIGHLAHHKALRALPVDAVITDLQTGLGPLMGIYTGLMYTQTPLNLFVSCDMPRLDDRTIERLVNAWSDAWEIVAHQSPDGRIQPLPLLCHQRACRTAGRLLDQKMPSLQNWIGRSASRLCPIENDFTPDAFTNVNTPEDYERLCGDARGLYP